MSLFPVIAGQAVSKPQPEGSISENPAQWLSNNASYQSHGTLEPQAPYGKYATQADFLRAAERYLEESSSETEDENEGDRGPAAATAAGRPGPRAPPISAAEGPRAGRPTTAAAEAQRGHREHAHRGRSAQSRSPSHSGGSSSDSGRDPDRRKAGHKKRKRTRRSSRSPSPRSKRSRKKRSGKDAVSAGRSKKRLKKSHRRHSDNSDGSSSSGSSSGDDGRRNERAKILRLERAAAAAGLAPRQAAALTAAKPVLKGVAPQPGDMYYDTRGDMDNLVYECLYGSNVASYHRADPLGLSKGARAYRLLPGQVLPAALSGRGGGADDDAARGAVLAARYFGAKSVAAERSRRLRRVFLAEAPVLPGSGARGSQRAGEGDGRTGTGGTTRGSGSGWLMSRLEGPTAAAAAARSKSGAAVDLTGFKMAMPMPSFIPLADPLAAAEAEKRGPGSGGVGGGRQPAEVRAALAAAEAGGESAEEWVLRRTREFNMAVREAPQDVQLWLRFAAFQDVVAKLLARRGPEVAGSAAEKKLAILQRALEAHPGHTSLLRAMMVSSEPLLEPEALMDRWERLLRRTPGDPALWRDYLARRRGAFASAKLSGLQVAYGNAMHALASERARQQRQAATASAAERPGLLAAVSALDWELVRLVLELVELEMGAGASEVAVARVQALVEFHCFAPGSLDRSVSAAAGGGGGEGGVGGGALRLSAGALLRLFDNFWEAGAPRVGEEGAVGWASWYRRENDALWVAKGAAAGEEGPTASGRRGDGKADKDDDGGGWTGWIELPPPPPAADAEGAAAASGQEGAAAAGGTTAGGGKSEGGAEEEEEEASADEGEEGGVQLTEEELLAQLGLRLDEQLEEMQRQGVPPDILRRWLRTERERSARDWAPLRPPAAAAAAVTHGSASPQRDAASHATGAAEAAEAQRVVLVEDIRDGIFPIEDPDLKLDLILGCLRLLGVPLTAAAAPSAAAATDGNGGGESGPLPLISSSVGCCPQSFLRLLPQQAAVATCQGCLPASLAAAITAACGAGGGGGGGDGGADVVTCPWYLRDESRRAFVARMLRGLLTRGPYGDQPQLCLAYLLVEAARAAEVDLDVDVDDKGAAPPAEARAPRPSQLLACADRAREAARGLLSERRNSLAVLMALAALEDAAGQPRAARRARDAALAGATALPPEEQRLLPLLVQQYAEAERATAVAAAVVPAAAAAAALEPALRAHHVLRWFLASWLPARSGGGGGVAAAYVPYKPGGQVTLEDVAAARRGFEARIPALLSTQDGALDSASASCLYLGGLFEALTGRLFPAAGGGLAAALTIFKHATAAVPAAERQASGCHEALAVSYCGLVVSELEAVVTAGGVFGGGGVAAVQPARARMALLQALELYPHNPQLLALRLQLGRLARAQCRLRRDLVAMAEGLRRRAEVSLEALAEALAEGGAQGGGDTAAVAASAAAAVWWCQLAAEAGQRQARAAVTDPRVSRLLERAATARHLASCSPVWTAYLGHEAGAGSVVQSKRVFLRAVREVPLSKDLWMLGLTLLGLGHGRPAAADGNVAAAAGLLLSSREVSELLGVAADKGVRLRTDVYEIMLQHLAELEQ